MGASPIATPAYQARPPIGPRIIVYRSGRWRTPRVGVRRLPAGPGGDRPADIPSRTRRSKRERGRGAGAFRPSTVPEEDRAYALRSPWMKKKRVWGLYSLRIVREQPTGTAGVRRTGTALYVPETSDHYLYTPLVRLWASALLGKISGRTSYQAVRWVFRH